MAEEDPRIANTPSNPPPEPHEKDPAVSKEDPDREEEGEQQEVIPSAAEVKKRTGKGGPELLAVKIEGQEDPDKVHLEELHEALTVVSSKTWVGLLTFSVLLFAVLLWALFGKLPVVLTGVGIFTSDKGIIQIASLTNGVIDKVMVKPRDNVKPGDPLVRIYDPEDKIKRENAELKYRQSKARLAELRANVLKENPIQLAGTQSEIEANRFQVEQLSKDIPALEGIYKNKKILYEKGLITLESLRSAENTLSQARIQLEDAKAKGKTLQLTLMKEYRTEEITAKEREFLDAEEVINLLKIKDKLSTIVSEDIATIIEVKVQPGQAIHQGEMLIWAGHPYSGPEEAVIIAYVPLEKGKLVQKGNAVDIEVGTVNMFEYGVIKGHVVEVSDYAVSMDQIKQKILNEGVIKYLMSGQEALVEVQIRPNLDPNTYSGYQWSSGAGPDVKVSIGTTCRVKITVNEISPIYYIFPLWRLRHPVGS